VSAAGAAGLGRFELALAVPEQVGGLLLDGVAPGTNLSLARDRAAELSWEPGAQGDHLEVELYVGGSVLACTMRDDGYFVVPRERLEGLDLDDNAALVLRRVHIAPIEVQGVESAYARVSSARSFNTQLR